jgi:hypothetical protein
MHNESRIVGASAKRIITPTDDTIEIDWERFLFNLSARFSIQNEL